MQPAQQHGLRMPLCILDLPTSILRCLVSGFLASSTQHIHSLRASGVMSCHIASIVLSANIAFRKSSGSLCAVPSASCVMTVLYRTFPRECSIDDCYTTFMNLQPEADFFHYIAAEVRRLVLSFDGKAEVAQYKDVLGDYATEVDVAVENCIVTEISKRFPNDVVLAEEGHSDVVIPNTRIWIIDPICGTTNLGRGLKNFCTNIALAENKQLIASCVVDHSQNDYFWSIGNNEVYVNDQLFVAKDMPEDFGVVIDIDFGALGNVDQPKKKLLTDAAYKLTLEPGYMLQSLSSSLGFAYTAVGKVDGYINSYNHPWDICAASFLLQQRGGVITQLDGAPWMLESVGAIGASSAQLHAKLLEAYIGEESTVVN